MTSVIPETDAPLSHITIIPYSRIQIILFQLFSGEPRDGFLACSGRPSCCECSSAAVLLMVI